MTAIDWEDPDEGWSTVDDDGPVVCLTHRRFLPCRRCDEPAATVDAMSSRPRWSADPVDVEQVRAYQAGESD